MTLKKDLEKERKRLVEERSFFWQRHTAREVAEMEKISVTLARQLMEQAGIEPDNEYKRIARKRKALWTGKTVEEIQELEPEMGLEAIRNFARRHEIKIAKLKRGRKKKQVKGS